MTLLRLCRRQVTLLPDTNPFADRNWPGNPPNFQRNVSKVQIETLENESPIRMILQSSLERKESRGPFFRRDFPETDNANWLTANVLKKTGNGFRFEQRPYELPFFTPGFVTKDNLEVAW